jgi:lysophospholipase L1-like esterase
VLLASLPPQRADPRLGTTPVLVDELNAGIRSLAGRQSVLFVDVNRAFAGNLSLIGPDGVHPTEAGYQRIAQAVFDALRTNFESTSR